MNDRAVPILFLTSSREFAVDSYDVNAFHYLIKPVSQERLFAILDHFLETLKPSGETFLAQTDTGFYKILIDDVDYLEAQNKHVIVYMTNGTTIFQACLPVSRKNYAALKEAYFNHMFQL